MKKRFKTILLTAMVTAALGAGTVSAHQLSLTAQSTTCRGFCTKKVACPNILGCGCVFQPGFTTGVCAFIAEKTAK
ncbi:MAG: hypothetical protein ACM3SW_00945 [Actinomycetota bacterium]